MVIKATVGYASVHDVCVAYRDGRISQEELIGALVRFPIVKQAPLPDEEWYDAIIVNRGPVYQLRQETYTGLIPSEVYTRAAKAMLDAGHAA